MNLINEYIENIKRFEADFNRNYTKKEILMNQTFLAWYVLVEGNSESDRVYSNTFKKIINRNYLFLDEYYRNDAFANFLIGWMVQIAPWFFENDIDGMKLMRFAFKSSPQNLLFKWAIRSELNLSKNEIEVLKREAKKKMYNYFEFDPICDYFFQILND